MGSKRSVGFAPRPAPSRADAARAGDSAESARSDLRNLLDATDVSVLFLDENLRVRRFSPDLGAILGLREDQRPTIDELTRWFACRDLARDARTVLSTGYGMERNVRLAGQDIDYTLRLRPCLDSDDAIAGLMMFLHGKTDRRRADEVSRRLAAIVESSDDAILSKDLDGIIASWNRGAQHLFGYTAEEVIGKSVTLLIPDDHPNEEPDILARIRRGEAIRHYETVRRRKDGSLVDISLTVSPIVDADGVIVGASKIARDISERRRAESERTLLLHELNHRVKNSLATVQSIASQTLRHADSLQSFADAFNARLLALSKTHDLLTQQHWQHASLRDLVLKELEPYGHRSPSFSVDSDDIQLHPRMALAFGLMFHELATNAVKYGALSVPGGHIHVSWTVSADDGQPRLRVCWVESGGPTVVAPTRRGMGTRLLDTAVADGMDGRTTLEFDPAGIRYMIDVPLDGPDRA
jgi:PAS domain S-box-containing protein